MVWAFLAVIILVCVFLIGMYNSLVQLKVRCDSAWSDIDIQLKRRHDLIPNLVEPAQRPSRRPRSRSGRAPCRSRRDPSA